MKNKKTKSQKNIRIVCSIIFFIILFWYILVCPGCNKSEKVFITINEGETINAISRNLKENGIIRNEFVFKLVLKQKHADNNIKAGTHIFSNRMDVYSVVKELTKTTKSHGVKITIPEGYTIAQIQEKLDEKNLCPGFKKKALNMSITTYDHLYTNSTEGYLFPDTYEVTDDEKPQELVDEMIENFQKKVEDVYFSDILTAGILYFNTDDTKEALYKVLTVASLIEREAKIDSERKLVSSVIYNRLKKDMKLQICATVSYVPGKSKNNKEKVYIVDTKKKTPYNTYVIKGLPKGPICNPGIKSIEAACHPAKTDYLFYVAQSDGSHKFTKTYNEHVKAK